jgi:hypothetical protein
MLARGEKKYASCNLRQGEHNEQRAGSNHANPGTARVHREQRQDDPEHGICKLLVVGVQIQLA